jgi:hypothetical protein
MNKLITSKPQNYHDYTGIPDKVIQANENLVKDYAVKFNTFSGWIKYPIYKDLLEVDTSECNKPGIIYHYIPKHTCADKFGMMKYKLIGVTKKKSDKRILLIVEDTSKNPIFKHIYLEIVDDKVIDCGRVYDNTFKSWDDCKIGSEYTGHRRAKWIKLDPNDFINLTGKCYR